MSAARVRVVIVDDHPVVRDGLKASLGSVDALEVVGEAATGEDAIEVVLATRPDVVLMDLDMPGIGGQEATRVLMEQAPDIAVLVLTMYDDVDLVLSAVRAGARGYLLKGAAQADVVDTIAAVARGDAVFGGVVADRLLAVMASTSGPPAPFPELTARERDVLELLADGLSNPATAKRLGLSARTVANHVSAILTKLGVSDRAQAAIAARKAGLGTPDVGPRRPPA